MASVLSHSSLLLDARLNSMPTNCVEGKPRQSLTYCLISRTRRPRDAGLVPRRQEGRTEGSMNTKEEKRAPRCYPDEAKLLLAWRRRGRKDMVGWTITSPHHRALLGQTQAGEDNREGLPMWYVCTCQCTYLSNYLGTQVGNLGGGG
jgi:hypothetical protein